MAKTRQTKETKETYTVRNGRTNKVTALKRRNTVKRGTRSKRVLGTYIVADPEICHGRVTFLGTRIFVSDVIEMVAEGVSWDEIIAQCHNSITKEAIAEAVRLAAGAFRTMVDTPQNKPFAV